METVAYCNRIRNSKPFYLDSRASGKYMVKEISKNPFYLTLRKREVDGEGNLKSPQIRNSSNVKLVDKPVQVGSTDAEFFRGGDFIAFTLERADDHAAFQCFDGAFER